MVLMYKQCSCHAGTGKGLHRSRSGFSGKEVRFEAKNYKNELFLFHLFLFCNFAEIIKGGKDKQRKN